MNKHSLIRTIYLYLFALLGLVLLVIGSVNFINMGLKAFVFKKAEESQRLDYAQPPMYYPVKQLEELARNEQVTAEEKIQLQNLIRDYQQWQERRSKIDYITAQRQREAAMNLSLIIVGLPLYFYHWFVIKRETKQQEA